MDDQVHLSKFLSVILRHRAQDFGLILDKHGFADFEQVREIVQQHSKEKYSEEDWQAVLDGRVGDKKRFEVVDGRLRALYGHSKVTPIEYQSVAPPEFLYHGTNARALKSIRRRGLQPMSRQYVHLSTTTERAIKVGRRRTDQVVLLKINASNAYKAGIPFYNPEPEHFLTKNIPPDFIDFPD